MLLWGDAGWVRYFSREPIRSVSDMKDMKIMASAGDPESIEMMKDYYRPVVLEPDQIQLGLRNRMIDGVPVPAFLANFLQLGRYAPYMVDLRWVPITGALVVRAGDWDRLDPATQGWIRQASEKAGQELRRASREEDEAAVRAMQDKQGLEIVKLSAEAEREWRERDRPHVSADPRHACPRGDVRCCGAGPGAEPAGAAMNAMIHGPQWLLSWRVLTTWLQCHARDVLGGACTTLRRLEDLLLAASVVALVLLGLAGATRGLAGADDLLRHMTLVVGMLGGMAAAREGRLLAIGSLAQSVPDRLRPAVELFTGQVSTAIAALLTVAAWQFVALEAQFPDKLAFGVPRVALQAVLPLGFAVLSLRLAHRSHARVPVQVAVLAVAVACALVATQLELDFGTLRVPLLTVLAAAMLLGAPIFVGLAGVALIFFLTAGDPVSSVPLDHYDQVTNPLLATLPLFTLAGFVVAAGGAGRRLVRVLGAWTGHLRGGAAVVTVLACAFFTAFTGGSGITILALGGTADADPAVFTVLGQLGPRAGDRRPGRWASCSRPACR